MSWDREIFSALFEEMKGYCDQVKLDDTIDRKTASVFWSASWWVKSQIQELEAFSDQYYENALVNLDHLAWVLFENEIRSGLEYEPL